MSNTTSLDQTKDYGYMVAFDSEIFPGVLLGFAMMIVIEAALFLWIFWRWVRAYPKCEAMPSPSHFLNFATLSTAAMLLTGKVLTDAFAGVDESKTPLVTWYGYNNVCMWLDFPPSTYVMPTWWCIIACSYILFAITDTTRLLQGPLKLGWKVFGTAVNVIVMFSACFFSTCLAIGPDEDMPMHTVPFVFFLLMHPFTYIVQTVEIYAHPRAPKYAKVSAAIVAMAMAISCWLFATCVLIALAHKHVHPNVGITADAMFMMCFFVGPVIFFMEEECWNKGSEAKTSGEGDLSVSA